MRTSGVLVRTGFRFAAVRFTAAREETDAAFFRTAVVRFTGLRAAIFGFAFALVIFVALCARALPAGERLVAGFRRVDFAIARLRAGVFAARRDDARVESFFPLLATGLLMVTGLASKGYI